MSRNVFVSYKYADSAVYPLEGYGNDTTARSYVDKVEELLKAEGQTYYGEHEGEDLSDLSEDQIWESLKDKIYPTSITIVLISPNMKENGKYDKSQWIPWEIRYSLIETVRDDRTSHRNAVLAVVLPDENGSYDYALEYKSCCNSGCRLWHTERFFTILKENMFNKKSKDIKDCNQGETVYNGYVSYIHMIRWSDFKANVTGWIEIAEDIKANADSYNLHLSVNQ